MYLYFALVNEPCFVFFIKMETGEVTLLLCGNEEGGW